MPYLYLEQSADSVWCRGTESDAWKKKPEICDPLGEVIALVEANLSCLVPFAEELQAEVRPLLLAPKRVAPQQFIEFRKRVFDVCETAKKENALLGRLAEAYLEDYDVFYLMEDYFDKLYKTENGQTLVPPDMECDEDGIPKEQFLEEDYYNAFQVLDAMRCGAELPWHLLQCQTVCEMYLDHVERHPNFPFPLSSYLEVHQVVARPDDGFFRYANDIHKQYVFHTPWQYYRFLIIQIDDDAHPVARCSYCGKYFAPTSKNNTKYCDRIQRKGRTCRDLGPAASHKQEALKDPVIETFDRVKRRMYKRRERFLDGMCTPEKALDVKAYFAWLDAAEEARKQYRAGAMSQEEALRIIESDAPGNGINQ